MTSYTVTITTVSVFAFVLRRSWKEFWNLLVYLLLSFCSFDIAFLLWKSLNFTRFVDTFRLFCPLPGVVRFFQTAQSSLHLQVRFLVPLYLQIFCRQTGSRQLPPCRIFSWNLRSLIILFFLICFFAALVHVSLAEIITNLASVSIERSLRKMKSTDKAQARRFHWQLK